MCQALMYWLRNHNVKAVYLGCLFVVYAEYQHFTVYKALWRSDLQLFLFNHHSCYF